VNGGSSPTAYRLRAAGDRVDWVECVRAQTEVEQQLPVLPVMEPRSAAASGRDYPFATLTGSCHWAIWKSRRRTAAWLSLQLTVPAEGV